MNKIDELPIEQQLKIQKFCNSVQKMPLHKTQQLLVLIYTKMIIQDSIYETIALRK
jgi:hypothetical protein